MARAPVKRFVGTLLFFIALIATVGFVFLLFADSENISSVPFISAIPQAAQIVGIALGVIALVIAILILVRAGRGADDEDEDMFFIPEKDRVQLAYDYHEPEPEEPGPPTVEFEVYQLASVPRQEHAWDPPEQKNKVFPYYFPRSVESALYANDYITIDHQGRRIKLRTLIAGPKGKQRDQLPRANKRHVQQLKKQEEERKLEEEAARLREEMSGGDGEEFMEALEEEAAAPVQEDETPGSDEVFYGYGGDNPAVGSLQALDRDVVAALREAGVETLARLLYEDTRALARETGYTPEDVARWQAIGELSKVPGIGDASAQVLVEAGVKGISDLRRRGAQGLADDIAKLGGTASVTRIEAWQEAARDLRRTKQRVPAA